MIVNFFSVTDVKKGVGAVQAPRGKSLPAPFPLIDVTNAQTGKPTFKFICVSRPRRFGKSIAEDMLAACYSKGADSRQLTEWMEG